MHKQFCLDQLKDVQDNISIYILYLQIINGYKSKAPM